MITFEDFQSNLNGIIPDLLHPWGKFEKDTSQSYKKIILKFEDQFYEEIYYTFTNRCTPLCKVNSYSRLFRDRNYNFYYLCFHYTYNPYILIHIYNLPIHSISQSPK
jgi:hypothetical protein